MSMPCFDLQCQHNEMDTVAKKSQFWGKGADDSYFLQTTATYLFRIRSIALFCLVLAVVVVVVLIVQFYYWGWSPSPVGLGPRRLVGRNQDVVVVGLEHFLSTGLIRWSFCWVASQSNTTMRWTIKFAFAIILELYKRLDITRDWPLMTTRDDERTRRRRIVKVELLLSLSLIGISIINSVALLCLAWHWVPLALFHFLVEWIILDLCGATRTQTQNHHHSPPPNKMV